MSLSIRSSQLKTNEDIPNLSISGTKKKVKNQITVAEPTV